MFKDAKWIKHPDDQRDTRLVPVFKKKFTVQEKIKSAVLAVTAHGIYEAQINGKPVTSSLFNPGFTSYYHRIQYQTYDIKNLIEQGENEWVVTVADGWWRWNNNFGTNLAVIGCITIEYENHTERIVTDETTDVSTGPLIWADLQKGEYYDARIKPQKWQKAVCEEKQFSSRFIPTEGLAVTVHEQLEGKLILGSDGIPVIDFGQNIAGFVKMKFHGTKSGQKIHVQHGEALDLEGKFSVENCKPVHEMEAFQEITYICAGGEECYCPKFSIYGFRYMKIEGYDMTHIREGDFTAYAVYSDMEQTGDFSCSNPLINKLVKNARWSQKGNFLDVPVDCPTRERNAWTGDAQIYCRTAAYFMNVYPFFEKWLKDQTIEQYESGKVGITFPSTSSVHNEEEWKRIKEKDSFAALAGPKGNGNIGEDSVGWGDAAVWIPYQMYLMYGNKQILENQYSTAKRWVEYSLSCMRQKNPLYKEKAWYKEGNGEYIYDTNFHYGEWQEPLPPSEEDIAFFMSGKSPTEYVAYKAQYGCPEVATAYTKRSCDNLAHMAQILGKEEDCIWYREVSRKIRNAYSRYMIDDEGVIEPGHQAAYIRALALDLVKEEKKPLVLLQLKKELEDAEYHLNTGFLSTVYLLPTLVENGLVDEAYRILEQTEAPGWLHPVMLGATTMLENWYGLDEFKESFNHYSFGAVCQFLFEYTAGIRPCFEEPGFKEFTLKPVIGGSLTWAKAEYKTKYGIIRSEWRRENNILKYVCQIPDGTKAHLFLPDGKEEMLNGGEYEFETSI